MVIFVGGGYVVDFGYNFCIVLKVIRVLEEDNWIDDLIMVVFIEFIIFELFSLFFFIIKFLFERFLIGGFSVRVLIKILLLYVLFNFDFRLFF